MKYLSLLSFALLCYCKDAPVTQAVRQISKTLIINNLGDSLCIIEHLPNQFNLQQKTVQDTQWTEFTYTDSLLDCAMDVRCREHIKGLSDTALFQFLYPIREVPDNWLEAVSTFHGKPAPLALWQTFFKGTVESPVMMIIHQNLDHDPELEYVIWYNRTPGNKETCKSQVEIFDRKQDQWFRVISLGPYFLPVQVRYIPAKRAVEITSINVTSDGKEVNKRLVGLGLE